MLGGWPCTRGRPILIESVPVPGSPVDKPATRSSHSDSLGSTRLRLDLGRSKSREALLQRYEIDPGDQELLVMGRFACAEGDLRTLHVQQLSEQFDEGLIGLSYWELGYRQMTNSKRPLNKVEDIEGLKLRVIPNPINVAWVKALGANPTPLPFPEVYAAMEQKAIDGQENPISVIAANKFWEVQKNIALTNHQYNPQSVIFSKKVWDTLTPVEKKIIDDAADEAANFQRKESRAAVAANLELLKKNGMTVTQFAPAEVAKLREKMKPVIAQFSASVGETTVNEMMAELAKLRK